jgi:hypothetical protein
MIDALNLRKDILEILSNEIGIYTFPDESTDTAIAVLPDPDIGWQYPEQGTTVEGLEVIIKQPYPETSSNLGSDRTNTYCWEIHLKQWDTQKNLKTAIELLINNLHPSDYPIKRASLMPKLSAPEGDKLLMVEQCKIFIEEYEIRSFN